MYEHRVTIHFIYLWKWIYSKINDEPDLLLHDGYLIANIKGDAESRKRYYASLEKAQTQNDKSDFIQLITEVGREFLEKGIVYFMYLKIVNSINGK